MFVGSEKLTSHQHERVPRSAFPPGGVENRTQLLNYFFVAAALPSPSPVVAKYLLSLSNAAGLLPVASVALASSGLTLRAADVRLAAALASSGLTLRAADVPLAASQCASRFSGLTPRQESKSVGQLESAH